MNLAARHALSLPFFRSALLAALPAALGIALSSTTILAGDRELAFVKGIYEKMRQNFRDPSAPMYLPGARLPQTAQALPGRPGGHGGRRAPRGLRLLHAGQQLGSFRTAQLL